MFIGKDFPIKPEYKQDLETYYKSDIQSVDFSKSQEAANTINTWCKEQTNDRIKNIINEGKHLLWNSILLRENRIFFIFFIYIKKHLT